MPATAELRGVSHAESILANKESNLKSYWEDVIEHIRDDIAYIWSKPVKKDFLGMGKTLEGVKYILKRFSSHYGRVGREMFEEQLDHIDGLIACLEEVEPSKRWIDKATRDLRKVFADFEKDKVEFRKYQGDLHTHSQDNVDKIPVGGSNCGGLAVAELIRYMGTRMGQKFIAVTDHSRDADLKGALGYWKGQMGMPKVARFKDERIRETYRRIDAINNPPLHIIKGVEVNLLPNGQFDSKIPSWSQVQCVNCSIHPKVRAKFAKIIKNPEQYTALVLIGIQNPYTNIMCHIGYGCEQALVESLSWEAICKPAIENKVAIEINLKSLMDFILKKLLNFETFPANSTEYREFFRKEIRNETSKYIPLIGNPKIRKKMKPFFAKGLKIAINTDLHWSPFIGLEDAKKDGVFREFKDLSEDNVNFRIMRIRFFVCLKIAEKEFQKLFNKSGIKIGNIINSYSLEQLAAFLRKPRSGPKAVVA